MRFGCRCCGREPSTERHRTERHRSLPHADFALTIHTHMQNVQPHKAVTNNAGRTRMRRPAGKRNSPGILLGAQMLGSRRSTRAPVYVCVCVCFYVWVHICIHGRYICTFSNRIFVLCCGRCCSGGWYAAVSVCFKVMIARRCLLMTSGGGVRLRRHRGFSSSSLHRVHGTAGLWKSALGTAAKGGPEVGETGASTGRNARARGHQIYWHEVGHIGTRARVFLRLPLSRTVCEHGWFVNCRPFVCLCVCVLR